MPPNCLSSLRTAALLIAACMPMAAQAWWDAAWSQRTRITLNTGAEGVTQTEALSQVAVPVRLHSACLTGDAFGSRRCDCGDQLRMAIARIDALGGGVLVYLAQEGCGLGLGNKMRAYRMQDQGLDTIDANLALGFERDERRYEPAARMLAAIGIDRVALLTNNPSKLDALRAAGIEVCERIPLLAPVGGDNHRYLETKRMRAGHLLDTLPVPAAGDAG